MRIAENEPKFRERRDQFGRERACAEFLAQDFVGPIGAAVDHEDHFQHPLEPIVEAPQHFDQPANAFLVLVYRNDQGELGRLGPGICTASGGIRARQRQRRRRRLAEIDPD